MADSVLIVWLVVAVIWDLAVFSATGYLVFWRGHSGWWFLLALIVCSQPSLISALKKRFGVPENEE